MRGERQYYDAVLRISDALSAYRELQELERILSEQLRDFLDCFLYKDNSTDVGCVVMRSAKSLNTT
jgi:hypothetical protein